MAKKSDDGLDTDDVFGEEVEDVRAAVKSAQEETKVEASKKPSSKKISKKKPEESVKVDDDECEESATKVTELTSITDETPVDALERLELETLGIRGIKTAKDAEPIYAEWRKKKIYSLREITTMDIEKLQEITAGVGEAKAKEIVDKAYNLLAIPYFVQLSELPEDYPFISCGVNSIDNLVGGGFRTKESYEFWGTFRSGKTQLCLQMCVRIQKPVAEGGLYEAGKKRPQVLYIDSEDTIRQTAMSQAKYIETRREVLKSRIRGLCEAQGVKYEDVVKNITLISVFTTQGQTRAIEESLLRYRGFNWQLIIMDSITNLARAEYSEGRQQLGERSGVLNRMVKNLQLLKSYCGAVLICTNQSIAKPDANKYTTADNMEYAAGGGVVSHGINVILHLRKSEYGKAKWIATVTDASYLDYQDQAEYTITEDGVEDLTETSKPSKKKEKSDDD